MSLATTHRLVGKIRIKNIQKHATEHENFNDLIFFPNACFSFNF
jgi:hypothetical protein